MHIEGVDERDSSWEDHSPRFRVYFFENDHEDGPPWSTDTYDVTGADVIDVLRWAQQHAGDERLYAIALVGEKETPPAGERRGLTWLVGMDANDNPLDDTERQRQAAMLARRGKHIVSPG